MTNKKRQTYKRFLHLFGKGGNSPIIITPYKSYGTPKEIYLRGRVLEDNLIVPNESKSAFRMLRNTIKRFNTHEQPGVDVNISINHNQFIETTDDEGYFRLKENTTQIDLNPEIVNWIPVHCHLVDNPSVKAETKMMIPSNGAEYGIISDIDDTIMHTGVSSFLKWRLVYNSLLKHVQKRKPLLGVPPFYKALQKGLNGLKTNPFFYISNSPWNLYNYLNTFIIRHKFPEGPILLRDFALPGTQGYRNEKNHKQREIINIFNTYPELKFVLIGDSAEHDASIYADIARQFPDRVICIYLHTIKKRRQMQYVESVVSQNKHVEMLLVNTAKDAAIHAKERGLISQKRFEKVVNKVS